jgi:hypothetical protein
LVPGANAGKRNNLTEGHTVDNLIRAGILIAMAFIGGTAGIAHNTVAHNTGSVHHISALASGPDQGVTIDGFSWG